MSTGKSLIQHASELGEKVMKMQLEALEDILTIPPEAFQVPTLPAIDEDRIILCEQCGGVKTYIIQIKSVPFDGWLHLAMPVQRCSCAEKT